MWLPLAVRQRQGRLSILKNKSRKKNRALCVYMKKRECTGNFHLYSALTVPGTI